MKIEDAIWTRYKALATTDEPDVNLLFDFISQYIKEEAWIYEGSAEAQAIYEQPENKELEVNCFILSDLLIHMSKKIGVASDECLKTASVASVALISAAHQGLQLSPRIHSLAIKLRCQPHFLPTSPA